MLAVIGVLGCSGRVTPPRTVPVSGLVTLKGKPAVGVRVKLHPQFNIGRFKFIPYGETGLDGKYTLSTGASGNGAPKGDYIVTVERPSIESGQKDGLETEVDQFKGAYSDPAKSNWKVTVKEGDNVLEPIQLN